MPKKQEKKHRIENGSTSTEKEAHSDDSPIDLVGTMHSDDAGSIPVTDHIRNLQERIRQAEWFQFGEIEKRTSVKKLETKWNKWQTLMKAGMRHFSLSSKPDHRKETQIVLTQNLHCDFCDPGNLRHGVSGEIAAIEQRDRGESKIFQR